MSGDVLLANDGSTDPQDNTVGTGEVVDNSLESADIKDGTIATADLGDDSVTPRKVSFVTDDIVPSTANSWSVTPLANLSPKQ